MSSPLSLQLFMCVCVETEALVRADNLKWNEVSWNPGRIDAFGGFLFGFFFVVQTCKHVEIGIVVVVVVFGPQPYSQIENNIARGCQSGSWSAGQGKRNKKLMTKEKQLPTADKLKSKKKWRRVRIARES